MYKYKLSFLSLLIVLSLVLTACGPQATPEAPATEEPTEVATEEPTEAATEEATPEPTEEPMPELVIWSDETRAPILEELGRDFTEEYGVKIVVQQMGFGDVRDQLKVAGPAGEGPDILVGAHDWLGELTINGLLAPIDLGDKSDLFLDVAVEAFTYDGKLYGMPYVTENIAFVRNPELVPDAPESWTEVAEIAAALEAEGTVKQGFVRQDGDPYHFYPILTAFDGYIFGVDENGYDAADVGVDSEGSLAAALWLEERVAAEQIVSGVDWDVMHTMFESGEAAMMITGPWALDRLREAGVPYAISPIPGETGTGRPFLGVQGFMINAFSENALLAQTFLTEFVATEAFMTQMYEADPRASAFLPVREQINDPDIAAFGEAGEVGMPMPAIPEMSAVWTALGDAITLVMQGQQGGEEAFATAAEQIRTAIAEE
ncbi:MAG: maltose ABC transporter substrate-binding protein [Anaerolineales bacterium]